jgi:hypothetical protein
MKILLLLLFSINSWAIDYGEESLENKIKLLPKPVRDVSIIVTPEGYYPKEISVFEGDKVHFYVTSTKDDPDCFMLSEYSVFLSAQKGKITEGEAEFNRSGIFNYYCPSSKMGGKVVVLKRKSAEPPKATPDRMEARKPAAVWMPKEY